MLQRVDSCAHRSRWRERPGPTVVLSFGLLAVAFLPNPWIAGPGVVGCAWCAARRAGVPGGFFLRALAVPLGFVVTGALVLSLSIHAQSPLLRVSPEGLATAWVTSARTLGATAATLLLALTIPFPTLLDLLRRWRAPLVVRDVALLTYRTLFLLDACARSLHQAQLARLGFRTRRQSLRTMAGTVQTLLVLALQRAQRWERGLAARGYQGELTVLHPAYAHPPLAYAAAIAAPGFLALLAVLWPALHP